MRCGHRPSKRVEQLVHLRLKSIYKAFKQSGAALEYGNGSKGSGSGGNSGGGGSGSGSSSDSKKSNDSDKHSSFLHTTSKNMRNMSSDERVSVSGGGGGNSHGQKRGHGSHRYAEMQNDNGSCQGNDRNNGTSNGNGNGGEYKPGSPLNGDVGAVLEVAAAAAASAAATSKGSGCKESSQKRWGEGMGVHPGKVLRHLNHDGSISFRSHKEPKKNASDLYASKTQAEADAAAAALLAELDEEKEQTEASTKAKKSKKKKKRERLAAKEREKEEQTKLEEEEAVAVKIAATNTNIQKRTKSKKKSKKAANDNAAKDSIEVNSKGPSETAPTKTKKGKANKKTRPLVPEEPIHEESDDDDILRLARKTTATKASQSQEEVPDDDVESRLANLIAANNSDGIDAILAELKGVPGRAALRKNAKKALKRIKEESTSTEAAKDQNDETSATLLSHSSTALVNGQAAGYKATEPLLKLVANNHRVQSSSGGPPRSECVMHMAPSVVGWVIGKGGQRIRDLMEDSGAKVWIDQDSMGEHDMRIVYVSGTKKAIDTAVRTIKDLVAKAPVGGTTQPSNPVPSVVNDAASITSARSDLTSTPVSMIQNFTTQAPAAAEKPAVTSPRRYVEPILEVQSSTVPPMPLQLSSSLSVSMPPPGMGGIVSSPTVGSLTVSNQSNIDDRHNGPPRAVRELFCEPRFVPLLIGRRGWTVKNIQDTSGARVDIDQKVIPRKIIISGDEEQVNKADRLVREVLSYPHAQSDYNNSDVGDGNIGVGPLTGLVHDTSFAANPRTELAPPPMSSLQGSLAVPSKSTYSTSPLEFGALPTRSLNDQAVQHQPNNFFYPQQSLTEEMNAPRQVLRSNLSNSVEVSPAPKSRQMSAPLPVRQTGLQMNPESFERNFVYESSYQDRQTMHGNFQYDTILPLNDGQPVSRNQFGNFPQESAVTPTAFPRQRSQPNNDQDMVNNLFGQPIPSPSYAASTSESQGLRPDLTQLGFGNLSLSPSPQNNNVLGLEGAQWDWDSLMNDEGASNRRVGLGGIRLDTSTEIPTSRSKESRFAHNWGM